MATLLEEFPDTQAVICVSDLSAYGALSECQRRGIDVPGQIAIAGFGDYEISAVSVPDLTTINAFSHQIGTRAARVILDALDGKRGDAVHDELIPELILRGSTGKAQPTN
jgi:LacI family gluconate utilization system Gnt-I transcriptional repressor